MKAIDYKKVEHSTKVEDCPGLYVLVSKSKTGKLSRSFAFRITVKGEAHKLTLGSVEKVTLADAKQQAKTLSSKITLGYNVKDLFLKFRGYNPTISGIEDHHRTVWTNEKLLLEWTIFQEQRGIWKNKKRSQGKTIMAWAKNHLSEKFLKKLSQNTTTKDIAAELLPCWLTHTSTPEKLLGALDAAFDWAIRFGYLTLPTNPAKSAYVRELLPASHVRPKPEHFPYLQPEKMPEFMAQLLSIESIPAKCLAFQIFCALRIENARNARWNQYDKEEKILKIQRSEMKVEFSNSPAHLIPLSDKAIQILSNLPRFIGKEGNWEDSFIFSNLLSNTHNPITEQSIYKTIRTMSSRREAENLDGWRDPDTKNRLGSPRIVVPHGLARTSFETWALDHVTFKHSEFNSMVIDYIMDHQLDNYRGAYKRRPPIGAMRQILQQWADFLCSKVK